MEGKQQSKMAQFTKKAIISTFLELVNKQSLDNITVKDIVEKCGINRNTFYYYFKDIYDLIENIFLLESQRVIQNTNAEGAFREELRRGIELVLEYRTAIKNMYYSRSRETIEKYLTTTSDDFISKYVMRQAAGMDIDNKDTQLVIDCYSASLCGITLKWISDDNGVMPDEFVHKLAVIYENTILGALTSLSRDK